MKLKKLSGFIETTFGLMFKNSIRPIYFETRWGIHTFFVKSEIDVLILDRSNRIVVKKENLKPWRLFFWNPRYNKVIETQANFTRNTNLTIGDKISLEFI